jgi:hypothetical protein
MRAGRGAAALEARERPLGRDAERDAARGGAELARQWAGVAPADLGQCAPRREAGAERDPQQVEHVGLLGLDGARSRAGTGPQPEVGSEEAGERGRGDERGAEPAGRDRRQRERREHDGARHGDAHAKHFLASES